MELQKVSNQLKSMFRRENIEATGTVIGLVAVTALAIFAMVYANADLPLDQELVPIAKIAGPMMLGLGIPVGGGFTIFMIHRAWKAAKSE